MKYQVKPEVAEMQSRVNKVKSIASNHGILIGTIILIGMIVDNKVRGID